MTKAEPDAPRQVCTFVLDDSLFAIDVNTVQEVLRFQELTPVPLAPLSVAGLMNLRGHIVTTIDLRTRLALPARPADMEPANIVIRDLGTTVSFLVDEVGDVVDVDAERFEPTPSTLRPAIRRVVRGLYKLRGELLLLMDPRSVIDLERTLLGTLH
jgi:purine-binding chemotaxis protein CheW